MVRSVLILIWVVVPPIVLICVCGREEEGREERKEGEREEGGGRRVGVMGKGGLEQKEGGI